MVEGDESVHWDWQGASYGANTADGRRSKRRTGDVPDRLEVRQENICWGPLLAQSTRVLEYSLKKLSTGPPVSER